MVSVKERTVKGNRYLYVSATSSYKGKKKRFERSVGPVDLDQKVLEERTEFFRELMDLKAVLYRVYMEAKDTNMRYLSGFYSIYLAMVRNFYSTYLEDLYPSELEKYQDDLMVRYIHHTTAIEGNTLTLVEAALVLEDGIAPRGKKLREIHEIENFKRLHRYIRSYRSDITIDLVKKVHSLVQRNIDDDQAGTMRRIHVGVVGSSLDPPPALFVEDELRELIDWYRENPDGLTVFELACIFHYRFVQIHPFVDGNGRVARELMNFILQRSGYPPLIIEMSDREEYLKRLKMADEGDPRPFIELLALKMITDYEDVIMSFQTKALEGMEDLSDEELIDIMDVLMWFMSLVRELHVEVPVEALEKIGSIRRFFEMSQIPSTRKTPHGPALDE
ncbi:MAG: Fic family protein [Candidatus Thermoplasmatota archaeon]|nr:Fic family protein [Candidatus Thermoplasmatota archaeon]